MGIALILGLAGAIAGLQPVSVDFKLDAPSSPPVAVSVQTAPAPDAAEAVPALFPRLLRPRVVLASGFGHDVPLDFAVRQVVPHYWHIQYGSTVDLQIKVSWQGGKPWDQVLHTFLAPLGLRMKPSGRTLWIME
jgi:hypothetical protein